MPLTSLLPPIAAATVLNAFLFALAWRAAQKERGSGRQSWLLSSGLMLYGVLSLCGFYIIREQSLESYTEVFFVAAVGEALGGGIAYAILDAFVFMRGQNIEHRVVPIFAAIFLTGILVAVALS
ncbi:hypothetical protein [Methylorubrum extorquens]|uniref:Uncharacterized protein n=1 Tax=Methylorubrum extorquens TaxID=408 RepID=A0AAX3WG47_METEX|nr:hypothetical protein [Methylorubrum extorquens]WHQ70513.1 hypothetical protein KEC54_02425 [Methylorubrum extorquens]